MVVSEVGRGTFVRSAVAAARDGVRGDDPSWQSYVLPSESLGESDLIVGEIARHVEDASVIALSAGYPSLELIPHDALLAASVAAVRRRGAPAFQYSPIEGVGELREALAALGRARGVPTTPTRSSSPPAPARRSRWSRARRCARATRRLRVTHLHGHHRGAAHHGRRDLPRAGRRGRS